jgi:hypothetical protein
VFSFLSLVTEEWKLEVFLQPLDLCLLDLLHTLIRCWDILRHRTAELPRGFEPATS